MSSFLTEVLFDSSTFSTLEHQMPAFAGHFQDSMLQRQVHSSSILRKGNLFVGHPSYALLRSKQPVLRHHRDLWPRHSTGFWFFRNRHCWFVFCAHLKKEVCSSSTNASIRHIASQGCSGPLWFWSVPLLPKSNWAKIPTSLLTTSTSLPLFSVLSAQVSLPAPVSWLKNWWRTTKICLSSNKVSGYTCIEYSWEFKVFL